MFPSYLITTITKMLCFPSSCFLATSSFSKTILKPPQQISTPSMNIKLKAKASSSDIPQVDYNSMASSVFPAEACETLGGVACDVEMFPETKLKQEAKVPTTSSQAVDREYVEYNSPKTVFIAEACDDLGGEFCDPAYQTET